MPTGLPMLLSPENNAKHFKWEIAGSKHGWSSTAMDWINFMSYDERFKKDDGSYYLMKSAITGEHVEIFPDHAYAVDGYVETSTKKFYLEFYGCRNEFTQ